MAHDPEPAGSYLRNNFTGWDWAGVFGVIATLFTGIWFIVGLRIEAETAPINASITVLTDEIEDTKDELTEDFDELKADFGTSETRILAAFEELSIEVSENVDKGMIERTDELSRALAARFDQERPLLVHVTNVPRDDPTILGLMEGYREAHEGAASMVVFGSKLQWTARIDDLEGDEAQDLQAVLEEIWTSHPEVETVLTYERAGVPDLVDFEIE
ncbi:hypothetical protein [Jannaschia aquimarina]|uniref:Uncharacterized protein n=1 Tax=Jannaschia aquimarina TaxID=935700 RepID=A0A0D1ELE3_9RHOB|nr:hypothetical protein [Jannaschia aquimarina]KIT16595.1 hypothetical protein jaqu_16900 [Jannaschia aquimarina]SNT41378.1 hypothetical protein SAMN05421775_1173 [Jannaschia aquimarina]